MKSDSDKKPIAPLNRAISNPSPKEGRSLNLPKIISFDALARCGDEVWIENNGSVYRLRRTRQGKLILTK